MASRLLLLLSIVIGLLTITTDARPCKTIFFITTTSASSNPIQNSNFPLQNPNNGGEGPYLTFFFTEVREFHPRSSPLRSNRPIFSDLVGKPFHSSVKTSIRDRTMDIMSIVGALLFGVGCGALTAATMYLVWSLFSLRRFDMETDSDEEEYASDPKKMEYVAVPPPPAAATKEVA